MSPRVLRTRVRSRRLLGVGLAALLSIASAPPLDLAAAANAALELPGDPASATVETAAEQALLDLTNTDRADNGVPELAFDAEALSIARQRAAAQLDAPALSHYDADGQLVFVQLLADAGVEYQLAGENLARTVESNTDVIQRIEQALMRSPTHRRNILEARFDRMAVGVATDSSGRIAFAEIFREE